MHKKNSCEKRLFETSTFLSLNSTATNAINRDVLDALEKFASSSRVAALIVRIEQASCCLHDEIQRAKEEVAQVRLQLDVAEVNRDHLKEQLETISNVLKEEELRRRDAQASNKKLLSQVLHLTKELQKLKKCLSQECADSAVLYEGATQRVHSEGREAAVVIELRNQLKRSIPVSKVQGMLQTAEARVAQICSSTKMKLSQSRADLISTRVENDKLRAKLKYASEKPKLEARMKDETLRRKRAEARADEESRKVRLLEKRLQVVEKETKTFKILLKETQEGLSLMRTIAQIRGANTCLSNRPIGFDAIAAKIDEIGSQVDKHAKNSILRIL